MTEVTRSSITSAMDGRRSRRQGSAITIREVAAQAGVSTMTVSRVINNDRNVRETTRNSVQSAMSALNYTPNPAAQSLAGADRIRIGLLYSNPSAAYLSEFLLGGLDQVSRSNVGLVVEKCDSGADELVAAQRLVNDRIDGVILPPPLCDAEAVIEMLYRHNVPAVAVATGRPSANLSAVSIDDRAAARTIAAHLIAQGHTRIGFIIGNTNQTVSDERLRGYRAALSEAGLPISADLEQQGDFSYRSGLDAAETLLTLSDRPTAIFASNDDMAAAAIAVAHRRSLDVPRDVSICGFDNTQIATTVWPELTTISQPIADMSRAAVSLLVDEIRARRSGEPPKHLHVQLDYALIDRDSVTRPQSS